MRKKYTPEMQKAAAQVALGSGLTPEQVGKQYPDLAEGLKLIESVPTPPRRGSGTARPSRSKPPQI